MVSMRKSAKQAARELHKRIWRERNRIWGNQVPLDPIEMLDPRVAIELLGYAYESVPEIGPWPPDKHHALAGEVDPGRKQVTVSEQFGPQAARFTAAHETESSLSRSSSRCQSKPWPIESKSFA